MLLLFAGLVFLSAIWSADINATLKTACTFTLYLVATLIVCRGFVLESPEMFERLAAVVPWAAAGGAVFLIFEFLTGSELQKLLFTYVPIARPDSAQHIGIEAGRVTLLVPDELNRSVAFLNLILWPSIAILMGRHCRAAAVGLAALVVAATFLSPNETSWIAITCGALVLVVGLRCLRLSLGIVIGGWLVATLLVLPLVGQAYSARLHMAEWLPVNGRARIIIWAATAEKFRNRPWLGVGAHGTRALAEDVKNPEQRPGHVIEWRTGRHAHNIFLQTWYELGVVGALLLAMTGLSMLRWIGRLPSDQAPYLLATFASASAIGAFGWGMWQPWLMAAGCVTGVLAVATTCLTHRLQPTLPPPPDSVDGLTP
jgi:O-antigen ligase